MTTPTPIRELCAKATPGPWNDEPHPADRTILIHGPQPKCRLVAELYPSSRLGGLEVAANAELIARLDPATVMLCVEALENCRDAMLGRVKPSDPAWSMSAAALRALNGQSEGGAK